jgi:hypothetical protein
VPDHEGDWLAEKMLPEGVHNREDDFTVFFLHATQPTHDELEARGAAEEEGVSPRRPRLHIIIMKIMLFNGSEMSSCLHGRP